MQGFLEELHRQRSHVVRPPGTAIYPDGSSDTVPLAMRATVARLGVLEECVVIVVAESVNSPHVAPSERVRVEGLGSRADGVALVTARFGSGTRRTCPRRCNVRSPRAWSAGRSSITRRTSSRAPGSP